MDNTIIEFRDRHALLLTEIKRLSTEDGNDGSSARTKELRSILKVVLRAFLSEGDASAPTEDELAAYLHQLEAA